MVHSINREREAQGLNSLQWFQNWHDIVFRVSEDNSEEVAVFFESYKKQTCDKINA